MKKIVFSIIGMLVLVFVLGFVYVELTMRCTMVDCSDTVQIITDEKLPAEISILVDGELLLDLCRYDETERQITLDRLYLPNRSEKSVLQIRQGEFIVGGQYIGTSGRSFRGGVMEFFPEIDYSEVNTWQIFVQPECVGNNQLLHQKSKADTNMTLHQPNGPQCSPTCHTVVIDLSS